MSATTTAIPTTTTIQTPSTGSSRTAAQPLTTAGAASRSADGARSGFTWRGFSLRGLATVVGAVLANTVFYYLGSAVVAYDPEFLILSNPSGAMVFTVVPAVVAVLLYAGLVRFTSRPGLIFSIISAVVFVVTLIPDFTYIPTVAGASDGQTGILVLMHVIAAAVILGLLTRTPSRRHPQGKEQA